MNGHDFSKGVHTLRGRTCPWNTFAIWDVDYLSRTGFLLISDGVEMGDKTGGVEVRRFDQILFHSICLHEISI